MSYISCQARAKNYFEGLSLVQFSCNFSFKNRNLPHWDYFQLFEWYMAVSLFAVPKFSYPNDLTSIENFICQIIKN